MSLLPKWVKQLSSNNQNRQIYIKLSKADKRKLESPREVIFSIRDIKERNDAESLSEYGQERGWRATYFLMPDSKCYWVEFQKDDYRIVEGSIEADEQFFLRLAKMYGATYDGWEASVE